MTRFQSHLLALACVGLALTGCRKQDEASREAKEAPPAAPATIETGSTGTVKVDKPSQFPLVSASTRQMASTLNATGSVNPDISRELPVLSLANGRVVNLRVRLGDIVHRGQPIMDVQSPDISTAFGTYLKAVSDEHLTRITLDRDKLLYDKGAIPHSQLEGAQDGEDDAKADLNAAAQQLRILGVDKDHPSEIVHIAAPASGVIIAQNVTNSGAAGITYAGNTGSLLIADLSHVWVIVDVYENDLAQVHLGQHADIHLSAFPGRTFSGTISDIGAVLDPSLRTAKVRIQVQNPDNLLRLGMFATATIVSASPHAATAVPATAVLQLHDRSSVFVPGENSNFRRVVVTTGRTLDDGRIVVLSGIAPGQQVVANALSLQNTADQQ